MPHMSDQIEQVESAAAEGDPAKPPLAAVDPAALERQVEAVLMSVDKPIPAAKIAEVLGLDKSKPIVEAIERLNGFYGQNQRSFQIDLIAGGYQLLTLAPYRDVVARLHKTKSDNKLSPSALETLAIIAYKQPIMRSEIETVRGVACGEVVRTLMEKRLVKIVGRAEELGRPMLYGTTKTFLEIFGLGSLKDLPSAQELAKP